MDVQLLLGDEAVGLAAVHAGISGVYGYPGTPSTEIFEFIEGLVRKGEPVHALWSANEKVAYEEALGMSFAGKRALVTMKHVGLNVAADPFMNSGLTGAKGGFVVAVADDPGMHSSQNEQDTRYFADFAQIVCFEPATQQEAYDMTREAFEVSERLRTPVIVRLVTRLAHSRAAVQPASRKDQNTLDKCDEYGVFTLLPSNARVQYDRLVAKQPELLAYSDASSFNPLHLTDDTSVGVVVSGVAYNYFLEQYGDAPLPSHLRVGCYPVPVDKVMALFDHVDKVLFIEEGYPFIEKTVMGHLGARTMKGRFEGKTTGLLPITGELTPDLVRQALSMDVKEGPFGKPDWQPNRPPALCPGCPHRDTFKAINTVLEEYDKDKSAVLSDIGCYTLGFYKPLHAIESCVDMGASISMASGAAHAGMFPVMCAIGDSTFGHSGMTGLLDAARENTNINVFILDNEIVAMTGGQDTLMSGPKLLNVVESLGIPKEHIRVINPLPKHHDENVAIIREEIAYEGLSVIVPTRPCIKKKR